jgi:hypothetical protein
MGKAVEIAKLEAAIADILSRKRDISLQDFVKYADFMMTAYRSALVRRMEQEPLSYSLSAFPAELKDAGLEAINKSLRHIADSVGYREPEPESFRFFDPANLGPPTQLRCSTCGYMGEPLPHGVCGNSSCESYKSRYSLSASASSEVLP